MTRAEEHARVLRALSAALKQFPTLRVGQLIENAKPERTDLFYLSDEQLAESLEGYCASMALADAARRIQNS